MNFLAVALEEIDAVLWIVIAFGWFAAGASLAYWQPANGVHDDHYRTAFYVYFIGASVSTAAQLAIAYAKRKEQKP